MDRMDADRRQVAEAQQLNGGYSHPPQQPLSSMYAPTGQLPLAQLSISSSYPVSPRQAGPPLPSPFETQRPYMYGEEGYPGRGSKYEATVNRAFEAWNYGEALNRIAGSSRTLFNFAEAFDTAAREQHGAQPIPSRLPTENEITAMLDNVYMIKKCLEDVKNMVLQSRLETEQQRARESVVVVAPTPTRKPMEEEDTVMYGSDTLKPSYGVQEVKKRRGRAAPPGRCHSCNRIDTPEWRRGPDGARTLCNACGLHYAKLERKRQTEQRSIRPKPSDERS